MDIQELRIKAVPASTFNKIEKSANFKDEFICDMLRPKMREILDKYPDEMKLPAKKERSNEIRIPGMSKKVTEQLLNIADNLGVSRTQFLRVELKQIADSLPEIK